MIGYVDATYHIAGSAASFQGIVPKEGLNSPNDGSRIRPHPSRNGRQALRFLLLFESQWSRSESLDYRARWTRFLEFRPRCWILGNNSCGRSIRSSVLSVFLNGDSLSWSRGRCRLLSEREVERTEEKKPDEPGTFS